MRSSIVFGALGAVILILVSLTVKPFFSSFFFAFVTAYVLSPLHTKLSGRFGERQSALLLIFVLLAGAL